MAPKELKAAGTETLRSGSLFGPLDLVFYRRRHVMKKETVAIVGLGAVGVTSSHRLVDQGLWDCLFSCHLNFNIVSLCMCDRKGT